MLLYNFLTILYLYPAMLQHEIYKNFPGGPAPYPSPVGLPLEPLGAAPQYPRRARFARHIRSRLYLLPSSEILATPLLGCALFSKFWGSTLCW